MKIIRQQQFNKETAAQADNMMEQDPIISLLLSHWVTCH